LEALQRKFTQQNTQTQNLMDMMDLQQGSNNVEMYAEELETAIDKSALNMDERAKVVMFVKGLHSDIRKKIRIQPLANTFIDVVADAIAIKGVLKEKKKRSVHFMDGDPTTIVLAALLAEMKDLKTTHKPEREQTRASNVIDVVEWDIWPKIVGQS
jgi:Retrotransposon gag protein